MTVLGPGSINEHLTELNLLEEVVTNTVSSIRFIALNWELDTLLIVMKNDFKFLT